MVSFSPNTIDYVSISTTNTNGETVETSSIVFGLKCFIEKKSANYKELTNGDYITVNYNIYIYPKNQRDKLPLSPSKNDTIIYNGSSFKILAFEKYQKHILIKI